MLENEKLQSKSRLNLFAKYLSLATVFFIVGYYTHSLTMTPPPGVLNEAKQNVKNINAKLNNSVETASTINKSYYDVVFDGKDFKPSNIVVPISRRVRIKNDSTTKLMYLLSEKETLQTVRGYGYSEAIEDVMLERGKFLVYEKESPGVSLEIIVE